MFCFLDLAIFERMNSSATAKSRYIDITDSPMNTIRYNNISRDIGSQRNSMNIQFQGSNRNSLDHPQSNRSSLDVSQSSYSTLIIHDNENPSSIFRNDSYFTNYSPSPPNSANKMNQKMNENSKEMAENDQQYLNQSYVLKHLAREANQIQNNTKNSNSAQYKSTRDSGLSDNNSSNNQSSFDGTSLKTKSKSQPDLTKLSDHQPSNASSAVNTLNNDLEVLAVENLKLREQLNECLMKVAKSQKVR
jgi:angiomotin like